MVIGYWLSVIGYWLWLLVIGYKELGKFKSFVVFGILLNMVGWSYAQNRDIDLLRNINSNRNKSFDPAFQFISNTATPLTIGIPVIYLTRALIKKDKESKDQAKTIVGTALVAVTITTSLKYAINRTRPGKTYPDIEVLSPDGSPSFPSGHTSSSFALATSLSVAHPKWYVVVPAYTWAASVAYSRMDLGAHYPTDVLAGAIIGSTSAWLNMKLNKYLFK